MVRTRRLILAAIAALFLSGCSTPPAAPATDPRDPAIYRPVNPQYPLPDED
ncbi:MAG: hypothetical protein V4773_27625 [Verrucomicrobiota bacterium]